MIDNEVPTPALAGTRWQPPTPSPSCTPTCCQPRARRCRPTGSQRAALIHDCAREDRGHRHARRPRVPWPARHRVPPGL